MSSSNAKVHRDRSRLRERDRWRRSPSITTHLALLYALLTFTILFIAIAVLYWALVSSLAHDDQRFLGEKIHVLRTMLSDRPNDRALLREEVDWEAQVIGHARYFVQILDAQGGVVIQTPGVASSGIKASAFPAPIPVASTDPRMRWFDTASGRRYLLSAANARLGNGGPRQVVRLAVDVSHENRILGDFRHIAELVLLAGVLLSGLLGALVARYGLRPMARLARTVEETTALRLDQRIESSAWPGEFVPLADAFNRLLGHLEEAFARLRAYAADLAHELRTPINNLMGETEVTLSRPRSAEDYQQTLASNLEEYQRLARMIDSLLFLARADNAVAHQTKARFDAIKAVIEVLEFYRPIAEEAGVALQWAGQGELIADRDLFRRALSNLVDNAIRYSARGGRIHVSLGQREDGAMQLDVADTGSGMTPDEQVRVFDRFFRGAGAHAASGSGLGLAIVKSVMWLHGGQVGLVSQPSQGTTVTLIFPLDEAVNAIQREET